MNDDFARTVHAAGVAGWWTLLAAAAVLALQWLAYLFVISARPPWVLSLWGSTDWLEVQQLWLAATVILKGVLAGLALLCLWLTLWARQLRKVGRT